MQNNNMKTCMDTIISGPGQAGLQQQPENKVNR